MAGPGVLSHLPMGYYERHLPHWQPDNAAVFLTWRLHGSLPARREWVALPAEDVFLRFDRELADATGPHWLKDERVARCLVDALRYGEETLDLYRLSAWSLLSNHVHILVQPTTQLSRITKSIKGFSARKANEILGRTGEPFWQDESYDHWVRNQDEFWRIVRYIEYNPVAAGLAERIEDWPWSTAYGGTGQEACPT